MQNLESDYLSSAYCLL